MNRLEQNQAAAEHAARIAAGKEAMMRGWTPPSAEEMKERRRKMNSVFIAAQGAADIFYALKAERLAAQAGTSVDSPDPAISDAISPKAHIPTI